MYRMFYTLLHLTTNQPFIQQLIIGAVGYFLLGIILLQLGHITLVREWWWFIILMDLSIWGILSKGFFRRHLFSRQPPPSVSSSSTNSHLLPSLKPIKSTKNKLDIDLLTEHEAFPSDSIIPSTEDSSAKNNEEVSISSNPTTKDPPVKINEEIPKLTSENIHKYVIQRTSSKSEQKQEQEQKQSLQTSDLRL